MYWEPVNDHYSQSNQGYIVSVHKVNNEWVYSAWGPDVLRGANKDERKAWLDALPVYYKIGDKIPLRRESLAVQVDMRTAIKACEDHYQSAQSQESKYAA